MMLLLLFAYPIAPTERRTAERAADQTTTDTAGRNPACDTVMNVVGNPSASASAPGNWTDASPFPSTLTNRTGTRSGAGTWRCVNQRLTAGVTTSQ